MKALKIILTVISFFIICAILQAVIFTDSPVVEHSMQSIENKVAQDAVTQYEIASREGDRMQMYVHAEMVAAAYIQAKDEEKYKIWRKRVDSLGKKIGLPKY